MNDFLENIKSEPKAFIRQIWRPAVFIVISFFLFLFCIKASRNNDGFMIELKSIIVGVIAPIVFIVLFWCNRPKDGESHKSTQLSLTSKVFLIGMGAFALISYAVFLFLQFNMGNAQGVLNAENGASRYTGMMATACYLTAIFTFCFWFLELINIEKLNRLVIPTYFINAGLLATLCCNIGILSNLDMSVGGAFDESVKYFKEAVVSTFPHLLIGLGLAVIMGAIVVFSPQLKRSRYTD